MNEYNNCTLCNRRCSVDRSRAVGFCRMPDTLYLARAALHRWEEPIISGTGGSGTIFFSGCSLHCIFCQNREISGDIKGVHVSVERLAHIMLELQDQGAHNVNFVTPTHYAPSIKEAVLLAKRMGLKIPTVYNTGSYDTPETIRSLEGIIDVYLPDLKYHRATTAARLSAAADYPQRAREAIAEMVKQVGPPVLDGQGILTRGVVVRVLLLPTHVAEAKLIVKYLHDTYGDNIYVSLMNQYTPIPNMPAPLNRKVTRAEYRELCDYADRLGIRLGFTQDGGTAAESFIPSFNAEGVLP